MLHSHLPKVERSLLNNRIGDQIQLICSLLSHVEYGSLLMWNTNRQTFSSPFSVLPCPVFWSQCSRWLQCLHFGPSVSSGKIGNLFLFGTLFLCITSKWFRFPFRLAIVKFRSSKRGWTLTIVGFFSLDQFKGQILDWSSLQFQQWRTLFLIFSEHTLQKLKETGRSYEKVSEYQLLGQVLLHTCQHISISSCLCLYCLYAMTMQFNWKSLTVIVLHPYHFSHQVLAQFRLDFFFVLRQLRVGLCCPLL